jgi:pantetheine-phosphate adenylyltransferase
MSMAVYAGTFDPITAGHLSVVRQAVRLFNHVVVLVAVNPKKVTLFTVEERLEMIRGEVRVHPNVSAAFTTGMVVDHARLIGANLLLRGVRGATDAQFETELAQQNRDLAPEITTLFLPAFAGLSEVSSSRLKELARGGKELSTYCSPEVAARLTAKLGQRLPEEPR